MLYCYLLDIVSHLQPLSHRCQLSFNASALLGGGIMSLYQIVKPYWILMVVTPETLKLRTHHAGFGVVRVDLLHFLAGCCKRRLSQAVSVIVLV